MHDQNTIEEEVKVSFMGRAIISVAILLAAGAFAFYFVSKPAKTENDKKEDVYVVRVDTVPVELSRHAFVIEALGQVRAAEDIELRTRVSGEIIATSDNFVPGGFFEAGDEILKIDPADYALDVQMSKAALAQAKATLEVEKGQQEIARDELSLLQDTMGKKLRSTDLALRKPQMEQAQASVDSAKAQLEMSQLNLSRTTITAPFNALLVERMKKIGDVVSAQDVIASLASTGVYWIELEVPVNHLQWIRFADENQNGSTATVEMAAGMGTREAYVRNMVGRVDAQSRLAQIIVEVPDPLLRNSTKQTASGKLILDDYVRVIIQGGTGEQLTARIEQRHLRDGNTVWLKRDDALVIQPVRIVYQDRKYAYVSDGLRDGDLLITSGITTPVDGMAVSSRTTDKAAADDAKDTVQKQDDP